MAASRAATVRQQRLGAELRRLREVKGLTGDDVADYLRWSPSKVSRIENARIGARVSDVRMLLELYKVGESHLGEILALAQEANQRGWWSQYSDIDENYAAFIALEDEADTALQSQSSVMPGLFQTEDYARRIIQGWNEFATITPQMVDRLVEVRMRRQLLLTRANPLNLAVVLDESVLLRHIGDRRIMQAQLRRLIELASLPNVRLQVLRLEDPRQFMLGDSFTLLEFSPAYDVVFPDVAHTESLTATQSQDEQVTYRYRLAWERLANQALRPAESLEFVSRIAQQRWRD